VLLAPRFGLDDSAHADFDATLVLATMMTSQLHGAVESTGQAHNAGNLNGNRNREDSQGRAMPTGSAQRGNRTDLSPGSAHRSDETAIWSELSGV
jgi:cell cycle checkpoint control protein RAD9A